MGSSANLALQAASFLTGAYSQHQQANNARAQGNYSAGIADSNAILADAAAKDAVARGQQAESRFRLGTRNLIGAQRAAAGASGVDVNSGSALDVQADSAQLGEMDALTIRNNAQREAYGFGVQAANDRAAAANARQGGSNAGAAYDAGAASTLLTGSAQLYDTWKKNKPTFSRGYRLPAPKYEQTTGNNALSTNDYSGIKIRQPRRP